MADTKTIQVLGQTATFLDKALPDVFDVSVETTADGSGYIVAQFDAETAFDHREH